MSETMSLQRQWHRSQVATYCLLVSRGKPVASCQVPARYRDDLQGICEEEGCLTLWVPCTLERGWLLLFIYRRPFLREIIEHSLQLTDANAVEVFFRGCMYGYEIAAIEEMAASLSAQGRGGAT